MADGLFSGLQNWLQTKRDAKTQYQQAQIAGMQASVSQREAFAQYLAQKAEGEKGEGYQTMIIVGSALLVAVVIIFLIR